ncbi:MAG: TonB-dependent receptor [Saprospiraceae bacterium]|nr:TonB-dependent receptor [Saprospiraceae bacterium]
MTTTLVRSFALLGCLFVSFTLAAQDGATLSGKVIDAKDGAAQLGVSIFLLNQADSSRRGAITDLDGIFLIRNVPPGDYLLSTSFISYLPTEMQVTVDSSDIDLGRVYVAQDANLLKEVLVQDKQIRVQQLGDTTQYNADAYKTTPNATVEDLIQKMPGITVEGGVVKVQGEELRKITIDGEDFFGDDATLALRNLPAEIVDKIQVFDRLSEQAQFTGFDDGNTQKTLNIVTKSGKADGRFGKIYSGYGTDNRYIGGASLNYFKGKQRISLVGLTNNINQQNFTSQDLLGITSGGGSTGGRGGGGGGRGGGGRSGGPSGGGGASANNFLTGQQPGISSVNSLGLNYTDRWGEKFRVNSSYFFNNNSNDNTSRLSRAFFLSEGLNQRYDEENTTESDNFNHRFNARLEYNIDSSNSLLMQPQFSFQDNSRTTNFFGQNYFSIDNPLNITENNTRSDNAGYSFSNNLLYRHRFEKRGRTLSLNLGTSLNDRTGERRLFSQNQFFNGIDTTQTLDQLTESENNGLTLSSNLVYTEPVGEFGQLQLNYTPSFNQNQSDQQTNNLDTLTGEYSRPDLLLSNRFENKVTTQRAGTSYRLRKEKMFFTVGLNYQNVRLNSEQVFPFALTVSKTFQNLMPDAMFNYRPSKTENLRLMYRTSTNVPSVSQLQNVLDNSNPLLLSIGNPELRQPFTHSFTARYNKTNPEKATSFMANGFIGFTDNFIGNSTLIAARDTTVLDDITLLTGTQLNRPINLEGYWNARSFFTYGLPVTAIKSNLNLNIGFTYQRSPSLINSVQNFVKSYTTSTGLVLSSNISEKVDFTLSYNANFNVVRNTLQPQLDNNFFFHNANARANWEIVKKLTLSSDVSQTLYTGLGDDFNQQFWLWNAAIGYRMLHNESLEIRLGVFDLLNQNNSIGRNVTETFVEDSVTQVLRRFFMLTATYTLRNFGGR